MLLDSNIVIYAANAKERTMSTLAEIEQAAEVLPVDQKQRLIATLQAGLPKRGTSSTSGGTSDQAARASLLPLAATAWSQDWDSAEEDEAWRDL
jgi:predicted nucleic acid-binding protein